MTLWPLSGLLLAFAMLGQVQTAPGPQAAAPTHAEAGAAPEPDSVEFSFVPRGAGEPGWSLRFITDTRWGQYKVTGASTWAEVTVGRDVMKRLEQGTAAVSGVRCETKLKNIAKTGVKTITYDTGTSTAMCVFDYSDDAGLNETASTFQAIAETMRLGEKIAHDRRFDHLGLNADLETLMDEAKAGRAIELGNIAPVLQSVVDNDDLMDVVRRRAQSLMQDATLGAPEKK